MKATLISASKQIYDKYVRAVSRLSKSEQQKEIVYLMSFPNNDYGLVAALSERYKVTVFYTKNCLPDVKRLQGLAAVTCLPLDGLSHLTRCIRQLKKVRVCVCDNYFAFLGDIDKSNGLRVIQIWHATGAIKQFGYEDLTAQKRSSKDRARFTRVYQAMDYIVVGSEAMADVFERSYGVAASQIWLTGFPRTDYLVNAMQTSVETDHEMTKRTIVYLPTYRENLSPTYPLDIQQLEQALGDHYRLIIKEHPHSLWQTAELYQSSFVTYANASVSADDLVQQADVLLTDYSSVAFDYALIKPHGRLVFYWYDEATYGQTTGLQPNIKAMLPPTVCHTTTDVIARILDEKTTDLTDFKQMWHTYNDGQAIERLLDKITREMGDA